MPNPIVQQSGDGVIITLDGKGLEIAWTKPNFLIQLPTRESVDQLFDALAKYREQRDREGK